MKDFNLFCKRYFFFLKAIWYLLITAEILDTDVDKNTALKFFITPYFSENHLSAVEMYLAIRFEQKRKDSYKQTTDEIFQRSGISAKTLAY